MHRMTYSSVHLCNPPEAISDGRLNPATDTSLLLAACGGRLRYLPYTPQCASSRSVFLLYRKAISCKVKKTTHPRLIYCQQTLWSLSFFCLYQSSFAGFHYGARLIGNTQFFVNLLCMVFHICDGHIQFCRNFFF